MIRIRIATKIASREFIHFPFALVRREVRGAMGETMPWASQVRRGEAATPYRRQSFEESADPVGRTGLGPPRGGSVDVS